jgi:aminopeptidase N
VPAYAIAFYAGTFTREAPVVSKTGVTVTVHGRGKSVRRDVRRAYQAATAAAIDFFSGWLGPYAYGKRFALVEVAGSLGCMENAGAAAMMVGAIQGRDEAREMAVHEAAHHWFGDNLRIRNSGEFWMSEGFTNYLTYRFFRHTDGDRAYHKLLDRGKRLVEAALRHRQHRLEGPCYCDVREMFTDIPYELGPWILRMMEAAVGTPRFDDMLAAWYRAHRFSAVDTREFLRFAKSRTGRDFDAMFGDWSRIDAVPSFRDRSRTDGDRVRVHLRPRTAVPDGLRLPLVLEGVRGERKAAAVDPRRATTIDAGFRVRRLSWDPERRVLAHVE